MITLLPGAAVTVGAAQHAAMFAKGAQGQVRAVEVMDGGDGHHYVVERDEQLHAARQHGMTYVPVIVQTEAPGRRPPA